MLPLLGTKIAVKTEVCKTF